MAKKEKKKLEKKNWIQQFTLIGRAKVNDYTFKLDERSTKSDWVYNVLNLGVDCGEKHGTVYAEMSGGYGAERDNVLYVHGKKEDGTDDFENNYTIDFDDRLDESILKDIGGLCFIKVGIEKDSKDKTFVKYFLSGYDAIQYVSENLADGMVINVRGDLKYSLYNDNIQCKNEIKNIFLSNAEESDFVAKFTQTMLLDRDSAGDVDKDKNAIPIYAKILEKFKEFNGHDLTHNGKVKGGELVPLSKTFEYEVDPEKKDLIKKIKEKLFDVKKGITQTTFEGIFIESGAAVVAKEEDIPQEIKDLVDIGVFTLEEALEKCSENGSKERRMILLKPLIRQVGDEGDKKPVIQQFKEIYAEDDLQLDCLVKADESDSEKEEEVAEEEVETDGEEENGEEDPNAWLNNI